MTKTARSRHHCWMRHFLASIGAKALDLFFYAGQVTSLAGGALMAGVRPSTWTRPARNVLARQILFTAVEAIPFISFVALLVGVSFVMQATVWLNRVGQSGLIGTILVTGLVRELGPLLTGLVLVGRSGAAITTELGNMRVNGEDHLLEALGVDPFFYLAVPRMLGMMISLCCLTLVFVVFSLLSGFLLEQFLSEDAFRAARFMDSVLRALRPVDMISFFVKTLTGGLVIGTITVMEGLRISGTVTEVPQAVTRALVRSVGALFIISAAVTVIGLS